MFILMRIEYINSVSLVSFLKIELQYILLKQREKSYSIYTESVANEKYDPRQIDFDFLFNNNEDKYMNNFEISH